MSAERSDTHTGPSLKGRNRKWWAFSFNWRYYLLGCVLVALATLLGHLASRVLDPTNIIMIYLLCVTITAILGGLGPSILVSVLSVLSFDFFFVLPYYTLKVEDTQYIFTLIVLLLVGIALSYFTSRFRSEAETSRRHEREMAALYALGQDLAVSSDLQSYTRSIIRRIQEATRRDVLIFLPAIPGGMKLVAYTDDSGVEVDRRELDAVIQCFQRREIIQCERGALCLPLVTTRRAVGVILLKKPAGDGDLTGEQERLLSAYSDLAAVAIESIQMADELHDAEVLKATEKLQMALLNAISHDLRTPLVSIIGVLSSLQQEGMDLDDTDKQNLVQVAREEADRLNHLITNLLDESRLESGTLKLSRRLAEVSDLIGASLEQMGSRTGSRTVNLDLPAGLPFVNVDFGLIVQALVNILDNALKYSPPVASIDITARQIGDDLEIAIADQGIGIPAQDLPYIFDKFYRIRRPDNVAGTGLGLSIARGIVEAHGGRIEAKGQAGGGAIIIITLPAGAAVQTGEDQQ